MDRHVRDLGENGSEISVLLCAFPRRGLENFMRDISPQLRSKQHHGALGKNCSIRVLDVEAHLLRVNGEPFRHFSHRSDRHTGRLDYGGNDRPLGLPASDAPFVLLQHRREKRCNQSWHPVRRGER